VQQHVLGAAGNKELVRNLLFLRAQLMHNLLVRAKFLVLQLQ